MKIIEFKILRKDVLTISNKKKQRQHIETYDNIPMSSAIMLVVTTITLITLVSWFLLPNTPTRANDYVSRQQTDVWVSSVSNCFDDHKLKKQVCVVTKEAVEPNTREYVKQIIEGTTTNNVEAKKELVTWLQDQNSYINRRFGTHDTVYQTRLLDPYGTQRIIMIINHKGDVTLDMTKPN